MPPSPPAPSVSRYLPNLPGALGATWCAFWLYWAIDPYDRAVWLAENVPVVVVFAALAASYRRFRFSNTAYLLMSGWLFWHTVGGHYTFERVPFGAVTELFGFERNHFDRVGHFMVGWWAYPIAELMRRSGWIPRAVPAALFALFAVMAIAASYEIVEWWYAAALSDDPQRGARFLGSQGDVWDAQRDMLADTLGALAALALFGVGASMRASAARGDPD